MQRMQLSREDFDNPEVAGAVNPHPDYGYFHGPIPNPNPTWRPHPDPRTPVTTADNENAPTSWFKAVGINSMVCDIAVNGNQMCGQPVGSQIALRRHIRNAHPGATLNPFRTNIPQAERIAGENALKRWILSRGWRTARYVKEPGEGPIQEDNDFAQQFGTEFHRPRLVYAAKSPHYPLATYPTSAPKRKRAPPKKGHKELVATSSRKQPARGKKNAAESVPETA
ncbi:uncharacterized protein ATNIH1004_010471 [Aspergillus tanneri]|uniref:Uncharacterized protein n=1 Tax=Aspergillus tanneri TaxID=1220188 RepID=A0A5M9MLR2_9EURO|nr:uncharacterized protein ATNIH1004_010471 [Aspergillus tanneri]KAA8643697.1 hypothetical protein ATNIH1004_010471 [Aspergillus tanneri]